MNMNDGLADETNTTALVPEIKPIIEFYALSWEDLQSHSCLKAEAIEEK